MISDTFVAELRAVFQAQNDLLRRMGVEVERLAVPLSRSTGHADQIATLERMLTELEQDVDTLRAEDLADFEPAEILGLYHRRREQVGSELQQLGYTDWRSFVRQCQTYDLARGLDPLAPYEALLTATDLAQLRSESYEARYRWDAWDYLAVGVSGLLAALVDCFLVRIPKSIASGAYRGQQGSPLTAWLKRYDIHDGTRQDWFAVWARALEERCRVPYDRIQDAAGSYIPGMGGATHRFQSLGHDPVLGFVFGVLDILRGTLTGFSYTHLLGKHAFIVAGPVGQQESVGLIEALLTHIGHLISDVATKAGLPAPLMPLLQILDVGSFGPKGRTIAQIARWMYTQGYDLRHFVVGGLTPAVIEMVLRAFIMLRHYLEHGESKLVIGNDPKYRSMLLVAHALAAAGNAGKVSLLQGNPLAINMAQWIALFRYLLPTVKYQVFDRARLKLEHIETINDAGWAELEANAARIVELIAVEDFPVLSLGVEPV